MCVSLANVNCPWMAQRWAQTSERKRRAVALRRSLFSIYQLCVGRVKVGEGGGKSVERVTHFLRTVIDAQWRHLTPRKRALSIFPSCCMFWMDSLTVITNEIQYRVPQKGLSIFGIGALLGPTAQPADRQQFSHSLKIQAQFSKPKTILFEGISVHQ